MVKDRKNRGDKVVGLKWVKLCVVIPTMEAWDVYSRISPGLCCMEITALSDCAAKKGKRKSVN